MTLQGMDDYIAEDEAREARLELPSLLPEGFMDLSFLSRRKSQDVPTKKDHVERVSTVIDGELCQGRSIIPAILGWPPTPPNEAMGFGSTVHGMIEGELTGNPVSAEDALVTVLREDGFFFDPVWAGKDFYAEVVIAFRLWQEQVAPGLGFEPGPYRIEQRLFRPLGVVDGTPVWLRGTADLSTDLILTDWKTANKAWSKGRADRSIQLPLYRSLVEWNFEVAPTLGSYVVYDRTKETWDAHHVDLTDEKVSNALLRAFLQVRAIVRNEYVLRPYGDFTERGWYCNERFCDAWSACPLGGGA